MRVMWVLRGEDEEPPKARRRQARQIRRVWVGLGEFRVLVWCFFGAWVARDSLEACGLGNAIPWPSFFMPQHKPCVDHLSPYLKSSQPRLAWSNRRSQNLPAPSNQVPRMAKGLYTGHMRMTRARRACHRITEFQTSVSRARMTQKTKGPG